MSAKSEDRRNRCAGIPNGELAQSRRQLFTSDASFPTMCHTCGLRLGAISFQCVTQTLQSYATRTPARRNRT
jgi:hypothetical protein